MNFNRFCVPLYDTRKISLSLVIPAASRNSKLIIKQVHINQETEEKEVCGTCFSEIKINAEM